MNNEGNMKMEVMENYLYFFDDDDDDDDDDDNENNFKAGGDEIVDCTT